MLKRLIGISAALAVLVAASAAGATSPAQRFSAHSAVRQQAPKVRVTVQHRPSFRPTYRPMSQRVERPDIARSLQPAGARAEMVRASSLRTELLEVRRELQCVPSMTCRGRSATPRTERQHDRKAMKRQLAEDKPSSSTKF
jgi:hypothetical protein